MSSPGPGTAPRLSPAAPMSAPTVERPGFRSRWIVAPDPAGWVDVAIAEWELTAAGWADLHPHTETVHVLEGELHVASADRTVVAGPGATVTVSGGQVGRYWAPVHARMLSIYGPNPDGEGSEVVEYWDIAAASGRGSALAPDAD